MVLRIVERSDVSINGRRCHGGDGAKTHSIDREGQKYGQQEYIARLGGSQKHLVASRICVPCGSRSALSLIGQTATLSEMITAARPNHSDVVVLGQTLNGGSALKVISDYGRSGYSSGS